MRPVSKIFSDITKSASASLVQFVITLVTTPLMTRLYDPAAYATFGIINSSAALMVGIGLLSLPHAYLNEKNPEARTHVLQLMLLLLVGLALLALCLAGGMAMLHSFEASPVALALLPLLVLTYGIRQIWMIVATARTQFGSLSLAQIVEPSCSRGGSIALGALWGGNPVFILAAVAVGHLATSVILARRLLRGSWHRLRGVLKPPPRPLHLLRQHADLVVYSTASAQAQPLVMLGLQLALVAFFSHAVAGQYILAVSILTLPISLIALTTAPVLYRHFIEINHTAPETLTRYLERAAMGYLLAGVVILSPIFLFGEEIFALAFGQNWQQAGHIAATLSVAYAGTFALVGVQSIFNVTGRLRLQFMLEASSGVLLMLASIFLFKAVDFSAAMGYLSALWFFRNGVLLAACVWVTRQHSRATKVAS